MPVQFRGITHYWGPAMQVRQEVIQKKPDYVLRAKIQEGNEALYLSGKDLARCVKEKFDLDLPKELVEAECDHHGNVTGPHFQPLSRKEKNIFNKAWRQQNVFKLKTEEQSQQFRETLEKITRPLKRNPSPNQKNPFLEYYQEALTRNQGKDEYGQPIQEVVYQEMLTGDPQRLLFDD